jgi:hypothetical protein
MDAETAQHEEQRYPSPPEGDGIEKEKLPARRVVKVPPIAVPREVEPIQTPEGMVEQHRQDGYAPKDIGPQKVFFAV